MASLPRYISAGCRLWARVETTHEQLASMIGYKRVAVTRAFSKLKESGAIQPKERHIVVKDLGALANLAEAG
jgi:CRP-like cAMP-binding protein